MKRHSLFASRSGLGAVAISAFAGLAFTPVVQAADWSDTAVSLRYGTKFAEPFDNNADGSRKDITKEILALTNATGYKYGSTFINIDFLQSDHSDPGGGIAGNPGAQEVYGVFRNTFDIGEITGAALKMGPIRGYGVTAGIDVNTKNDGYASKKRLFVVGPTMMFEVPGFLLRAYDLTPPGCPVPVAGALLRDLEGGPIGLTAGYAARRDRVPTIDRRRCSASRSS